MSLIDRKFLAVEMWPAEKIVDEKYYLLQNVFVPMKN